ncbi:uncharacterized protein LOC110850075 isoform X2 [Folsomia candida]|uniref:uncharacterized protein LOC110850075 isoform X2 n=1 Tax=Folsomia candida TaxID=158441 RepID=UPI001604A1F6|nr:uncharacterized protein LOC110850075 isoform X2 [Folsomia candida]
MELKSNQKIDKLIELRSKIKVHEKLCHFSDILDDKFVNGFLEGKKYDVHETIFCLENYIELRTVKYRKLIQPFLPSRASLLGTEFVNFLSSRDHHGRHVAVFNIYIKNVQRTIKSYFKIGSGNIEATKENLRGKLGGGEFTPNQPLHSANYSSHAHFSFHNS